MTLALMALLAAAVLAPDESMFSGLGDESLDETLRKAVREARCEAVETGTQVFLSWSVETGEFIIKDSVGKALDNIKSDARSASDDVKFYFIAQTEGDDFPDDEPTLSETASIEFDADRSATPFVSQIHYAGEDFSVRYDSFSNLKLEAPK